MRLEQLNGSFAGDCIVRFLPIFSSEGVHQYAVLLEREGFSERIGTCTITNNDPQGIDLVLESFAVVGTRFITLHHSEITRKILLLLSRVLPPGATLTLSYSGDERITHITAQEVASRVPLSCTTVGYLLLSASPVFSVPVFLPEGTRVAVSKVPTLDHFLDDMKKESERILEFLHASSGATPLERAARERAKEVLSLMRQRIEDYKRIIQMP